MTHVCVLILQLTLGIKLIKLVFVSLRDDVRFRDAFRISEGDYVFWNSLLNVCFI
jgi:hypothetical protein